MKAFLVSVIVLASVSLLAPPVEAQSCHRIQLRPEPGWTFSGAWAPDGRLILVDVASKSLRAYDPDTGLGTSILLPDSGPLDEAGGPALVQRRPGRLLVEQQDRLFALDEGFAASPLAALVDTSGPAGLRAVHSWAATSEHILLYGDHYHPESGWRAVLAVTSFDQPRKLRIVAELDADGSGRTFYLNGQNYLAVDGDTGFLLVMAPRPHLLAVDLQTGEKRQLALPAALAAPVDFPSADGLETLAAQNEALAATPHPSSIVASGGLVYVLSRHPRAGGWVLTTYDPVAERALHSSGLPSHAEHAFLVPGAEYWAMVEKGQLKGLGNQEVQGALLIPTHGIVSGGSPCRTVRLGRTVRLD